MFCRLLIDNGILSCRYRLDDSAVFDSAICYPVGSAAADSVDFADFVDFELCFDYSCSFLSPPLILKKENLHLDFGTYCYYVAPKHIYA